MKLIKLHSYELDIINYINKDRELPHKKKRLLFNIINDFKHKTKHYISFSDEIANVYDWLKYSTPKQFKRINYLYKITPNKSEVYMEILKQLEEIRETLINVII